MGDVTNPSDVTSSIPAKYALRVMRKGLARTFWNSLCTPEGGGGAIIQRDEVLNKAGETITIQVTNPLTGAGQTGDTSTLEGSEEKLSTSSFTITPVYYRHGVRVNTRAQKKSIVDLRGESVLRMSEWGANKLDTLRFAGFVQTAGGTPGEETGVGTPYIRYIGGGAAVNDIVLGNVLTLAELSKTKYIMLSRLAKAWEVGGNFYLCVVLDQWSEYNIKVTDTVWAQAQREAEVRGGSNPLFTGCTGIWDGIVIKSAQRVTNASNAGGIRYARNLMFAQEAFVEAWGTYPDWAEDTFDYKKEWGIAYGMDYGCRRGFELNSTQIVASAPLQT